MSASYRVVHFVPDPLSGWRVPIGALVSQSGRPMFVQANWIPGPTCLGSEASATVLRMILGEISKAPNLQRLPVEAGPHATLSEKTAVPASVVDPRQWLVDHVLPDRPHVKVAERKRATSRDAFGYRFFEQYKVDRWVKKRFSPERLGHTFSKLSASMIAHFVTGKDEILLLEPVVTNRPEFDKELAEVSQLFLAWRQLFQEAPKAQRPRFIAYAFSFGLPSRAADVRDVLGRRFEVVDVDAPCEREVFLGTVKQVGLSGEMFSAAQ